MEGTADGHEIRPRLWADMHELCVSEHEIKETDIH